MPSDVPLERSGAFRIQGVRGRATASYRLTATSLSLRIDAPADGQRLAWRLRLGRSPSLWWAYRSVSLMAAGPLAQHDARWDLGAGTTGAGCASGVVRWCMRWLGFDFSSTLVPLRMRQYHRAVRWLRALDRQAFLRLDPATRHVAQRFEPGARWFVYRAIASDPSGRVAAVAASCPGLLVLAHGLHETRADGTRDKARLLLAAMRSGVSVPDLLDQGARAIPATAVRDEARERVTATRRGLIERAGPHVSAFDLLSLPPPGFMPRHVPAGALENAEWFLFMRRIARWPEAWPVGLEREPFLTLLSANVHLVVGRLRHVLDRPQESWEFEGIGSLLRYVREYGLRPWEPSHPRALLVRWADWYRGRRRKARR